VATATEHLGLKIIQDDDAASQDLINANTNMLDTKIHSMDSRFTADEATVTALAETVTSVNNRITATNAVVSEKANITDVYTKAEIDNNNAMNRVLYFIGDLVEVQYPWSGTAYKIQVNIKTALTSALSFAIEKESQSDYQTSAATWTKLGGSLLTLPAGATYAEFTMSEAIAAGYMLRSNLYSVNAENLSIRLMIKNTNL